MGDATGTILVVDDEPQLLRLIVRVLERAGLDVVPAADGDSAIELLAKHEKKLRLAVLDVIIPPAGGGAVLQEILIRLPDMPVILTSGDQLSDEVRELMGRANGVFLRKPFLPKALLRLVAERMAEAPSEGD